MEIIAGFVFRELVGNPLQFKQMGTFYDILISLTKIPKTRKGMSLFYCLNSG